MQRVVLHLLLHTSLQPAILHHMTSPAPDASPATPPEIDQALSRLSSYRNVRGVMILVRDPLGIVKSSGQVFEGEGGKKYARAVEGIVGATVKAIAACEEGVGHLGGTWQREEQD